jgi:hypothetical protein
MKSLLYVEGQSDHKLIEQIDQRCILGLKEKFDIKPTDGFGNLLKVLKLVDGSAPAVAVICDADEDCSRRWEEIKAACRKGGLDLGEERLPAEGMIWNREGQQKFACWIMPDNLAVGAIEGRLLESAVAADQAQLRGRSLEFARDIEPRKFPNTTAATQKAGVAVWLAVQEEPIRMASEAVRRTLLLPEIDETDAFVGWLRRIQSLCP